MRGGSLELPVFLICSAAILLLSRKGLRDRHSYGYYRFFAFEFTLLLIVTNLRVWFHDPFSVHQLLSWFALLFSVYLAVDGFRLLGFRNAAGEGRSDDLVDIGIYGKIRHPLYSSLLFLGLGAFLKMPSLFSSLVMIGAVITVVTTAEAEETVNRERFGAKYDEYMKRTRFLLPYLY